jgi:two-component system cell cycle response regulator DivK
MMHPLPAVPALAQPSSDRPRRDQGSGPRRASSTALRARPGVLIVDDDEDTRELYAWCLRAAGWLVEDVANGEDALRVAGDFAPDVIVMDLLLPVIGGLEATRRLKADPHTRHIPVVAISGADRIHAEVLARKAGCDEYVPKPCAPEQLRTLLENMLLGREGSPS